MTETGARAAEPRVRSRGEWFAAGEISAEQGAVEIQGRVARAAEATTGEVLPEGRRPTPAEGTAQFAQLPQKQRAERAGVSRRTQQKLDALARERPDLLERVRDGELSAHAAALEAKIVRPPNPLVQLRYWWTKASPAQRRDFEIWIEPQPKGDAA